MSGKKQHTYYDPKDFSLTSKWKLVYDTLKKMSMFQENIRSVHIYGVKNALPPLHIKTKKSCTKTKKNVSNTGL